LSQATLDEAPHAAAARAGFALPAWWIGFGAAAIGVLGASL